MCVTQTVRKQISFLKKVFLRRHSSAEHKKSWLKFEATVLYYRSNFFMISVVIMNVLEFLTGNSTYHKS